MDGSDIATDFPDWERELLGYGKGKMPKPTAKPAFDPFQEIEVKDSRHMFKIDPDKESKESSSSYGEMTSWTDQIMQRCMRQVHLRIGNKLGCGKAMPLFMWTWQRQEATCTRCQQYEDRSLKDRIDNLERPVYVAGKREGGKPQWEHQITIFPGEGSKLA